MKKPTLFTEGPFSPAFAADQCDSFRESPGTYWNFEELAKVPAYKPANFHDSEFPGFQAILYEGVEVEGIKSPVFAYISYPEGKVPAGGFPTALSIHGGGGTAYPYYIQKWNRRGYAVLAIDWYNQRPVTTPNPDGKGFSTTSVPLEGGKRQLHVPIVGNIVLAHSLLRTLPNVNLDKIGYVGLSWGSWYGSMVAALDPRFKFILNIYCGGVDKKKTSFINGRFLHAAKVPIYWVAQTVDQNITPEEIQAAYEETPMTANKTLVPKIPHSHIGYEFEVCFRIADSVLKGMTPLPKLGKTSIIDGKICAEVVDQGKGIKKCFFYYTKNHQEKTYFKRIWETEPAELKDNIVSAKLPKGVYQCFLAVFDDDNMQNFCCGSSDVLLFAMNSPK